jgi:hypothetical protein
MKKEVDKGRSKFFRVLSLKQKDTRWKRSAMFMQRSSYLQIFDPMMEVEGEKEANHAIIADFNFSEFSRCKRSRNSIIDFERAWHAYLDTRDSQVF